MLLIPALVVALTATASPVALDSRHALVERDTDYVPQWIAGAGRGELLTTVSILSSGWPQEGTLVTGTSNAQLWNGRPRNGTVFAPWDLSGDGERLCTFVIAQHNQTSPTVTDRQHFSLPRFLRENGLGWQRIRGMQCWPRAEVTAPQLLVSTTEPAPTSVQPVTPSEPAITTASPQPGSTDTQPQPEMSTTPQPTPPSYSSSETVLQPETTDTQPQPEMSTTPQPTPPSGASSETVVQPETNPATQTSQSTTALNTAVSVPTGSSSSMTPLESATTPVENTAVPVPESTATVPTLVSSVTSIPNATTTQNVTALPNATTTGNTAALPSATSSPAPSATVTIGGHTFINKGLAAAGAIPATLPDFLNHSVGAVGALHFIGLWPADRGFTGQMLIQPDRGLGGTEDFVQRYSYLNFELHPHTGASAAGGTLTNFSIPWTLAYKEFGARYITGKDATWAGNGSEPVPRPSESDGRRQSADSQGLAMNPDTTFWVAEGYAPSLLKMSKEAVMLRRFAAPPAFIPRRGDEVVFSIDAGTGVDKGRAPGRGFSGLTMSTDRQRVYVLLASALLQDSAGGAGRYSRLLAYDVSSGNATLAHSYVVELPLGPDGAPLPAGEVHYLSDDTFMVLAGDEKNERFYLLSTAGATDIAHMAYTTGYDAVAPNGALKADVHAAVPVPWIDLLDGAQLARFSLAPANLAGTWGSIAVANCQDPANPDDYFVFAVSNNHFGKEDTHALVWRVEIPLKINDA